jgi:hypothetical protein
MVLNMFKKVKVLHTEKIVLLMLILSGLIISLSSCGDRVTITRKLNFTIGSEFVPRGDTCWFKAKPNMHVKLDSVVTVLRDFNYSFTVHNPDTISIYFANKYFWLDWFRRVERGQVWEFIFYGKYPFNNDPFEARTAYVIQ